MPISRPVRDLAILVCGIVLGILGNLLAEFFIAYLYPSGFIPQKKAIASVKLLILAIVVDVIFLAIIVRQKSSASSKIDLQSRKSRVFETIAIIASVLVSLILISYLQSIFNWTIDALWASVYVTIVLVVINIYYAWQARQTTAEMEKARKAEFMPNIKTLLTFLGPMYVILKVTNFGKGPAINVRIAVTFSPSGKTQPLEQHVISPGESIRILLPEGNVKKVCKTAAKISVKGTYNDVFGSIFEIDDVIDTSDSIEKAEKSRQILEKDLTQLVKDIRDELGEIKIALKRRTRSGDNP